MARPVVHFEIIGKDPEVLRTYFGQLFGWNFDVPSKVAAGISEPDAYGFLTPTSRTKSPVSPVESAEGRRTGRCRSSTCPSTMWRRPLRSTIAI